MTTIPDSLPTISKGGHNPFSGEACAMEYISLIAGEPWSDSPSCTDQMLAALTASVNDSLSDEDRAPFLVPHLGRLMNTSTKDLDPFVRAEIYLRTMRGLVRYASQQPQGPPAVSILLQIQEVLTRSEISLSGELKIGRSTSEVFSFFRYALQRFTWWSKQQHGDLSQVLPTVLDAFEESMAFFQQAPSCPATVTVEQLLAVDLTGATA